MNLKFKLALFLFLFGALISTTWGQVVALPYQVIINPIFVQNGVGGNIAVQSNYASSFALFQEATQRVYAQAGIRVVWDTPTVYVSSTYYTIADGTAVDNLVQTSGNGGIFNNRTVNIWFVGPNGGTLGVSQQSSNVGSGAFLPNPVIHYGGTVSENIFSSTYYSLTTLPHEIGHVLGLTHNAIQPGPSYGNSPPLLTGGNVMTGGSLGATTLSGTTGITGDGVTGFGLLTADQILMLRLSPMVTANSVSNDTYNYSAIPEPSAAVLATSLLTGICALGYRWKNRPAKRKGHQPSRGLFQSGV